MKPDCLEKLEEKQLDGSAWRYSRTQSMDFKLFKIDYIGGSSYVELHINRRSIINVKIQIKTNIMLVGVF